MYDTASMDSRLISYVNIFLLANRLQTVMDQGLQGISSKQWLLLIMLGDFPEPPTLKELAERCGVTHQSTMQLVKKLAEKGYLTVEMDLQDRRAVRISTTEQCRQWTAQYAEQNLWFIQKMFSDLTKAELQALCSAQGKLIERLGKLSEYLKLCI